MQSWHSYSADQRLDFWLTEWEEFRTQHEKTAHLAVIDTLAGLLPDGPLTVLNELELWATECQLIDAWANLRRQFEATLWGQLYYLAPDYEAMPPWYTNLFFNLPLHYRRAAFLVGFLDFLVMHLEVEDPAVFQPLRDWLIAVARWSHSISSLDLMITLDLPPHNPLSQAAANLPPHPPIPLS